MRFQRLRDPVMSIPLIPWYIPTEENVLSIAMKVHRWMQYRPDDIYVLVIMVLGKCVAMSIVYINDDDAWWWQAQSAKGYNMGRYVLEGMKIWARSRGAKTLSTKGINKRIEKLHKRYGFLPHENGEMRLPLWDSIKKNPAKVSHQQTRPLNKGRCWHQP